MARDSVVSIPSKLKEEAYFMAPGLNPVIWQFDLSVVI